MHRAKFKNTLSVFMYVSNKVLDHTENGGVSLAKHIDLTITATHAKITYNNICNFCIYLLENVDSLVLSFHRAIFQ